MFGGMSPLFLASKSIEWINENHIWKTVFIPTKKQIPEEAVFMFSPGFIKHTQTFPRLEGTDQIFCISKHLCRQKWKQNFTIQWRWNNSNFCLTRYVDFTGFSHKPLMDPLTNRVRQEILTLTLLRPIQRDQNLKYQFIETISSSISNMWLTVGLWTNYKKCTNSRRMYLEDCLGYRQPSTRLTNNSRHPTAPEGGLCIRPPSVVHQKPLAGGSL